MTEEEREKAQEQMKALNQAYSELSQHCSDQNNSAEEVGPLAFYLLFSCVFIWETAPPVVQLHD